MVRNSQTNEYGSTFGIVFINATKTERQHDFSTIFTVLFPCFTDDLLILMHFYNSSPGV
jgi:hypothetical protein